MAEPILALDDIRAGYGPTIALDGVSVALSEGETISIIGRNGVGKTTLLATVMGHTTIHSGSIRVRGVDITRMVAHKRTGYGFGYVPQEREIFPSLSVRENLTIGARPGAWTVDRVLDVFPHIKARLTNAGNQLSGGEQQMLSIARALMTNPDILLLDEPAEGLAPVIVEELVRIMDQLRRETGLTIVLVEQNSRVALDFAERVIVMDRGRIVYDGDSATLRDDRAKLEGLIGVAG